MVKSSLKKYKLAVVAIDRPKSWPPLRQFGWVAYPVPEFDIHYVPVQKHQKMNLSNLAWQGFDFVYQEDYRCYPQWSGDGVALGYRIVDSDLSADHYKSRIKYIRKSPITVVLPDKDDLVRFSHLAPTRRFNYCVNDLMFKDWYGLDKEYDVSYCCGNGRNPLKKVRRRKIRRALIDFCVDKGYKIFTKTTGAETYAQNFARSKVSVDSIFFSRNHRFFDSMACRTCVLSNKPKKVEGESFEAGLHYEEFDAPLRSDKVNIPNMLEKLEWLLESGTWVDRANAGYEYIQENHTWKTRAKLLHKLVTEFKK